MRPPTRGTLVLFGVLVAAVVSTRWVRLNISSSVPVGLYAVRPIPPQLHRGDVVVLPVPASVRHVWSWWVPLLKPIAAIPGDVVCSTDNVLYVNSTDFGPVLREAHDMPLPRIDNGCQVIPEGSLFLASPVAQSLDSRYYGAVSMTDITAVALPIFTWR